MQLSYLCTRCLFYLAEGTHADQSYSELFMKCEMFRLVSVFFVLPLMVKVSNGIHLRKVHVTCEVDIPLIKRPRK